MDFNLGVSQVHWCIVSDSTLQLTFKKPSVKLLCPFLTILSCGKADFLHIRVLQPEWQSECRSRYEIPALFL